MMKYAIRYYTKSNHTKQLADCIAEVLDIEALDITHPLVEDVEVLFFGSSVYGNSVDPEVRDYIFAIDVNVSRMVCFGTAGVMESSYDEVRNLADLKDIPVDEREFHCKGEFVGMNRGKPDESDLDELRSFVRNVM